MAEKTVATLGGVPLAATSAITWRVQTGTAPYQTVLSVYEDDWKQTLKGKVGEPLALLITDARGRKVKVEQVYILHEAPAAGPHLASFVVSDLRWKWAYKLVVRDYNVPRKTGDRTAFGVVPIEAEVITDQYQYRRSSLDPSGKKWTAKAALEDVLRQVVDSGKGKGKDGFRVDSWPIAGDDEEGALSVQNLIVRDQGDAAIGRALGMIPGADLYVDVDGTVVVFDAADLDASDKHMASLPMPTWDGEAPVFVDRSAIRPSKVHVHYQREVELLLEYHDDMGDSSSNPVRTEPYLENVIPTTDTETEITQYDPETNKSYTTTVPAGTWVTLKQWLAAMDLRRPDKAFEWTWDTIRRAWIVGDLEGALGRDADRDSRGNVAKRIAALRTHFRQTFRINRRYMERSRDIEAVRVALLDPITGARSPAAVWAQSCQVVQNKGLYVIPRFGDALPAEVYTNIDPTSLADGSTPNVLDIEPSPAAVQIVDHDLGIFRVDWHPSAYGTVDSWIPGHLVDASGSLTVPEGDLAEQDRKPIIPGLVRQSRPLGLHLATRMRMFVLLTVVPAAPNNERQMHRVTIEPDDVKGLFAHEFRIGAGDGPELSVFIPPGEVTARFAIDNIAEAKASVVQLFGLNSDDPANAGIDGTEIPGFVLVNGTEAEQVDATNELAEHARAVAAEMLAQFADAAQGRVATRLPDEGLKLVGAMAGATVHVASHPSGKVAVLHDFPGQQRQISRMAMLSQAARHMILGIVQPKIGK